MKILTINVPLKKQAHVCGFLAVMLALALGACSAATQRQRLTGTDRFKFTVINNGTAYSVSAGTATEGTVNIPAYYRPNAESDYLPVTKIGSFRGCRNIIKITIPASVTSFGDDTFENCTSLTSITIPASVMSIGFAAFAYCTSLSNITIPANVTSIGNDAFTQWTSSQTINIEGHASQVAADRAWGAYWRRACNAKINYLGQ